MRKLFIIITLIVVSLVARAQVYDGITQPTKFRIFMPVTTSLHGNGSTVAPFVGYRADVAKWLSVTQVLQYNMTSEAVSFGAWLNVNYQQRFYLLARSTYNTKEKMFTETLSGTIKLPAGFMIDATWIICTMVGSSWTVTVCRCLEVWIMDDSFLMPDILCVRCLDS